MPVAHGHEATGIQAGLRQRCFQRSCLLLGEFPNWRAAPNDGVMMLHFLGARTGDELGQWLASDPSEGKVNNIWIAEKVVEKRFDCLQRFGSTELEKHYSHTPHCLTHPPWSLKKKDVT